jgi:hypothetical protein
LGGCVKQHETSRDGTTITQKNDSTNDETKKTKKQNNTTLQRDLKKIGAPSESLNLFIKQ